MLSLGCVRSSFIKFCSSFSVFFFASPDQRNICKFSLCCNFQLVHQSLRNIKHLMTGPEGNSEFLFPENLTVSRDEVEGNIEIRGKQNSLFPRDQSLSDLLYKQNESKF